MTPPSELAEKIRNYSVLTTWLHRNYSQKGFEYWSTIMFQPNHCRPHSFTLVSQNRSPYMTPPSELARKIRKYSVLTRWLHRNYSQIGFEYWSTILFQPNHFRPHSFTLVSRNRSRYMTPPSELAGKIRNYSVLTPWLHRNYSQIGFEYWSKILFQRNHFIPYSCTLVLENRSLYLTPPSE